MKRGNHWKESRSLKYLQRPIFVLNVDSAVPADASSLGYWHIGSDMPENYFSFSDIKI